VERLLSAQTTAPRSGSNGHLVHERTDPNVTAPTTTRANHVPTTRGEENPLLAKSRTITAPLLYLRMSSSPEPIGTD